MRLRSSLLHRFHTFFILKWQTARSLIVDTPSYCMKMSQAADSCSAESLVTQTGKRSCSDEQEPDLKKRKHWGSSKEDVTELEKKMWQSRREAGLPHKRKKMAVLMMYSGKDYYGMQLQRADQVQILPTIEGELLDALLKAGLIAQEMVTEPRKLMSFQRAARTDKGVSAAGQVVSLMMFTDVEKPLELINKNLPEHIRVLAVKRATKMFDSKNSCDSRTYSYLLPTFALTPVEQVVIESFRITDDILARANDILSLYKGTHNFHNFTSGKLASDASAKRYIMDMKIGKPFVADGLEFATIEVHGQSFMIHQIRKMIGLMIAIVRGLASVDSMQKAWGPDKCDVPKAPGLGLMLEKVHYAAYNKRFEKTHDKIDHDEYKVEIDHFKHKHIYPTMIETEKTEKSMLQWLATLHLHHFDIRSTTYPATAETAQGLAAFKLQKLNEKNDAEASKAISDSVQQEEGVNAAVCEASQDAHSDKVEQLQDSGDTAFSKVAGYSNADTTLKTAKDDAALPPATKPEECTDASSSKQTADTAV